MTREEQLDWLYRLRSEIYVYMPKEWLVPMNNALDMTIKAIEQEPSGDLIRRQAVLDLWYLRLNDKEIYKAIYDMPSVNPQEPKTGHWIKQTLSVKPFGEDTVLCDKCAFMTDKDNNYNYCPNCGARMVEPQEGRNKEC